MDILKNAQQMSDELSEIYQRLHIYPEIGFELKETVKIITSYLDEMDVKYHTDGKFILCEIGNDNGETFLLRADMDALPIKEESGLSFASKNGNCHACGHDMHSTMLLGAVKLLKSVENTLQGKILCLFQPAEELLQGAKYVLETGALDGVKAGMMIHTMTATPFETGTAIVSSAGTSAPSSDYFTITITGKGGHGSSPHLCIDPISSAAHLVVALEEILAREVPTSQPAVLTIGEIKGGDAHNIIPDSVTIKGTVRCFDEKLRTFLKTRLEEISQSISKAFRTNAEITYDSSCPPLLNDKTMSELAYSALKKILEKQKVLTSDEVSKTSSLGSGSEDFAYISHKIPTVMIALSAGKAEDGYEYPLHNPKVKLDARALPYGSAAYTAVALEFLNQSHH